MFVTTAWLCLAEMRRAMKVKMVAGPQIKHGRDFLEPISRTDQEGDRLRN